MAQIIWTEPALGQLDDIAEYIALENPRAAADLVKRVFNTVERLVEHPESGPHPPELPTSIYREIVASPCRVFYRLEAVRAYIVYVMREEQDLKRYMLSHNDDS